MRSLLLLSLGCAGLLAIGGCPAETNTPTDGAVQTVTPTISGKTSAAKGEMVTLSATVEPAVSGDQLEYSWYQTFGRPVALAGKNSAAISFEAPSLEREATLRFRVDVRMTGGPTNSATVEVVVAADDTLTDGDDGSTGTLDPRPQVRFETDFGDIVVELDRERAPLTVNNFLRYLDEGFYDGTIFHRVIPDFVVQGGGFLPGLDQKETRPAILSEADNGLRNDRGTIAMARQAEADSATSQFYFNLVDNEDLNPSEQSAGYTVFGRVLSGMDVVDAIAAVETGPQDGFQDVPLEDVVLNRAVRVENARGGSDGDVITDAGR